MPLIFTNIGKKLCLAKFIYTVKWKNLCTIACFWSKTTLIASSVSGAGVNPPFFKISTFFLDPWLLVCQFVEISNQMESNGEVSNLEQNVFI